MSQLATESVAHAVLTVRALLQDERRPSAAHESMYRHANRPTLIRKLTLYATLVLLVVTFLWPGTFPYSLFATMELFGFYLIAHSVVDSETKPPTLRLRPATSWVQFGLGTLMLGTLVAAAISNWTSSRVTR